MTTHVGTAAEHRRASHELWERPTPFRPAVPGLRSGSDELEDRQLTAAAWS
jgi:hypothetical protein